MCWRDHSGRTPTIRVPSGKRVRAPLPVRSPMNRPKERQGGGGSGRRGAASSTGWRRRTPRASLPARARSACAGGAHETVFMEPARHHRGLSEPAAPTRSACRRPAHTPTAESGVSPARLHLTTSIRQRIACARGSPSSVTLTGRPFRWRPASLITGGAAPGPRRRARGRATGCDPHLDHASGPCPCGRHLDYPDRRCAHRRGGLVRAHG